MTQLREMCAGPDAGQLQDPQGYPVGERRIEATDAVYLEPPEAEAHLAALEQYLGLTQAVIEAKNLGFAAGPAALLKDSVHALRLKHRLDADHRLDFNLMIDPTNSGFPTTTSLFCLAQNKADGPGKHNARDLDALAEAAWRKICHGKFPTDERQEALRRAYFDYLAGIEVFPEFRLQAPRRGEDRNGRRLYEAVWYGIEPETAIPAIYQMYLEQDSRCAPLERGEHPGLRMYLEGGFKLRVNLHDLAGRVDSDDALHPKHLKKLAIGPIYTPYTRNPPAVNDLFRKTGESTMMQFEVTTCASQRTRRVQARGLLNMLMGTVVEKDVYSLPYAEPGLLVPFRIKQELDKGITRQDLPSAVYGFTGDGTLRIA